MAQDAGFSVIVTNLPHVGVDQIGLRDRHVLKARSPMCIRSNTHRRVFFVVGVMGKRIRRNIPQEYAGGSADAVMAA